MKKKSLFFVLCTVFIALNTVKNSNNDYDANIYKWAQAIAEVFQLVKEKYLETIDPERLSKAIVKALNAFLNELDPHSALFDSKSYATIIESTQGEFYGIGIVIDSSKEPEQEVLKIIDLVPAGPADKAGLRPGDKIVSVDGKILKGLAVDEIVALLKGKRNTIVQVKIQRNGTHELLDYAITRDKVTEQNALCYHFKENHIYYLGLSMFTENSVRQVEELLRKCQQQKSKGLILDLRNNSGGLLQAAVDIAGLFIDRGSLVVSTKTRDQKVLETFSTKKEPLSLNAVPIFILVNNYTASAAEILAGALQHHSATGKQKSNKLNVFLIGTKTWGKGSVQEVIPICNDCAVKLTIALYHLPNDQSIQSQGLQPDFTIPMRVEPHKDLQWLFNNDESNLRNSIKNSVTQNNPNKDSGNNEKSWQEKKMELLGKDHLVINATRLIEMLALLDPAKYSNRATILEFLHNNFIPNDAIAMDEIKI